MISRVQMNWDLPNRTRISKQRIMFSTTWPIYHFIFIAEHVSLKKLASCTIENILKFSIIFRENDPSFWCRLMTIAE